ncbi:polyhydroxyalkanoate depolymerase, intracellular [compost metagenome]
MFQDFKLVNGTWDVKSVKGKIERVRPEDIKATGLLTIEGELDDISGSGQTAAAHDLCTSIPKTHQMHYEAKGAGHYGIFSGRRWRDMVYPVVKSFIRAHQPAAEALTVTSTKPAPQEVKAVPAKAKAAAQKPAAKAPATPAPASVAAKTPSTAVTRKPRQPV